MDKAPFTVTEKIELISDIKYIKGKIDNLACKKNEEKITKISIYLAVLAALTIGGSALKMII